MSYHLDTVNEQGVPRHGSPRGSFDRVYDRLLRDLVARAIAGVLFLLSLAVSITSFADVIAAIERASAWMWLVALGGGWLAAFGVLEIGRRFNLALLSPDTITDEQYWAAEERFRATASRRQHAEYERVVTIRDGSAIASVSLFLSLGVLAVDFVLDVHLHESPWSEIRNGATALVALVAIGVALQLAHRQHVRKAWRYLTYLREDDGAGRGLPGPPPA